MRYPKEDQIAWQFDTARFRVILSVEDCIDDPADQFEDAEDVASIREGQVMWFDAFVSVWFCEDAEDFSYLGHDSLGCCAYRTIEEFVTGHRDANPENRNTLAMKARNRVVCHYFPGMVFEALADARRRAAKLSTLNLKVPK